MYRLWIIWIKIIIKRLEKYFSGLFKNIRLSIVLIRIIVTSGEIQTHLPCGLSPVLINLSGAPWIADYVTVTGYLFTDLLSNIASEQRAIYSASIGQIVEVQTALTELSIGNNK